MVRKSRKAPMDLRVRRLQQVRFLTERGDAMLQQALLEPERADHLLAVAQARFERAEELERLVAAEGR